uniref:Uncharacterized protein n=1 Tax=Glossina palpalis gambiensis TaxID=67801 RepID=A0A1B0AQG8_9MUSC
MTLKLKLERIFNDMEKKLSKYVTSLICYVSANITLDNSKLLYKVAAPKQEDAKQTEFTMPMAVDLLAGAGCYNPHFACAKIIELDRFNKTSENYVTYTILRDDLDLHLYQIIPTQELKLLSRHECRNLAKVSVEATWRRTMVRNFLRKSTTT